MKKYLPIGSVVLLKGGTKKIMIYGRKQLSVDTGKAYDYVACFYPEGNVSEQYTFMFNQDDIETVVFTGYEDQDEKTFVKNVLEGE
ncbi:DUF4176 domain-containing protein [Anaerosacchariphilus polymeriproducens]|uniref:DUF4176 domain-containing protein n=1 Tax=Anaerosacchariphilus polymeriproducens TaxID=1812858 RepID=A0A371AR06_9FIRM|nr:DUF4176 domain-containing protein [Anaerosacchariphilus polymeriproducens]RDU22021.1 DUF4176 domain-containing protein [Anaerosacchariphilus polymeriproducens]